VNAIISPTHKDDAASASFSNLEIFLSAYPGNETAGEVNGFTEMQSTFIRSLEFFWPRDNLRTTVVLDENIYANEQERNDMTSHVTSFFSPNVQDHVSIVYNPLLNSTLYGKGWFIQQLVMFWADNFTNAEYIGFVDDDTIVSRAVQAIDLFDELGRPRVIARMAKHGNPVWNDATAFAFKRTPKIYAMTYFPVIMKRDHLIEMRQAILQTHHPAYNTFDEFFTAIIHRHGQTNNAYGNEEISQFCIMMDYVFEHHRDEYSWHMEAQYADDGLASAAAAELLQPFPRVAVHGSYLFKAAPLQNQGCKETTYFRVFE
jgi:hypothetical protein